VSNLGVCLFTYNLVTVKYLSFRLARFDLLDISYIQIKQMMNILLMICFSDKSDCPLCC